MAVIVLAGGESLRMGSDKALLPWRRKTVLEHVIDAVSPVSERAIVVGGAPGSYRLPPNVPQVADIFVNAGPLGGIITGLVAAGDGYHAVIGCDMPCIGPSLLRLLFNQAEGRDAAVPEVGANLEPLCAVYHHRCVARLLESLQSGQRAVHAAILSVDIRRVPEEDLRKVDPGLVSFTNLNSPEDYDQWQVTEAACPS